MPKATVNFDAPELSIDQICTITRREYLRAYYAAHPEAKEARNAYQREYRKAHPEKVKNYKRNYWLKKYKELEAEQEAAALAARKAKAKESLNNDR